MTRTPLSLPEIGIIAGTRAAFGAGVGLLLAGRLSEEQRRAAGWTLLAVGAITTIPILGQLLASRHEHAGRAMAAGDDGDGDRAGHEEPMREFMAG
jgi:hypothetical protein